MLLVCAVALSGGRVQAEETIPRVLILGDQVYQQPAADLKKELKGKAEIHYPRHEPGVVWNTTSALELLDRYLGEGKWDPDDIKRILLAKNRAKAGPTAPADGLYFLEVIY